MAELGQTTDPRALIPGAPETIEADAVALARHGTRMDQVGTRLRSVGVGDWDGLAGARFARMWAGEPPKWFKVADAVGAATAALTAYAGTLRWAQGQAAGAVTLWEQAEAQTRQAAARYDVAATEAAARCEYIEPFTDPGEPLRREAQDVLAHARDQLRAAGDRTARAVGGTGLPVTLPGSGADRAPGSALDVLHDTLTGSAGAAGGFSAGGVNGQGRAGFNGLTYGAEASGPDFHLAASDGLRATAEVTGSYGILGARTTGEAFGGLRGDLGLDLTPEKVGISAEGFAGGKAAVDFGADLAGIGVGMHSEAWAGIGAKLDGGYEFKNGKFHLHGHIGAALGIGGSEGLDITVDPEKVERTVMEAADSLSALFTHPRSE